MALKTKIRSKMMGLLASSGLAQWQRTRARYLRLLRVESPRVLYFHQVDDPYSHLVVQRLAPLQQRYRLPILAYLVPPPTPDYQGDAEKFETWARRDATAIAPYFGVEFSPQDAAPTKAAVQRANQCLLDRMTSEDFATAAIEVGQSLWAGEYDQAESDDNSRVAAVLKRNSLMRNRLGHYLGGTFYFEGEWYWGLDRLHLLEQRLQQEGYDVTDRASESLVCPLPQVADFPAKASDDLVLEYFPSLRSPYTAIGHQRVLDLVAQTGVQLKLRPVMPMMMRGIPAPRNKQKYIMADASREARFYGDQFGPFCDPLGEPVKRAFAAYHYAESEEKGLALVTAYLAAAFAEGLDITERSGLAEVCNRAGFSIDNVDFSADWRSTLDANLATMAQSSLWGVPSFRILGGGREPFACWGQDRIWRVAAEIAERSRVS